MTLVRFFPTLFLLLFAVTSTARAQLVPQTEAGEATVPVHALAFLPDSKQLLAVGRTPRHTLWRWDVASGEQLRTIELSDYAVPGPFKYAFSADAKLLAMPGPQGKIQLRNTSDGEIVQEFELLSEDGE